MLAQTGCKTGDEDSVFEPISDPPTGMYYVGKLGNIGDVRYVKGYTINKVQYAFMACGSNGYCIANVTNGESPAISFYNSVGGYINEILVDSIKGRHYAFLSNTMYGIAILDVTEPSSTVLKQLVVNSGVTSMSKKDSLLFAANGTNVQVYNLSLMPDSIYSCATYTAANTVNHIEISGNLCCLVETTTGLEFVDITNPLQPVQYSTFMTPGSCNDIKLADNLGYVADGLTGVSVISISNPAQPYFVRSVSTSTDVRKLDYSPNFLFTAENISGAEVFNLFDPAKPDMIGYYQPGGACLSVHFYKAKVLVANGINGLLILRF